EQLALIYSAADLFVVSSHFANLPQTAVESMSCGTPVIAYDVGGLGELITSGENGWLVGRHDPAELARRVRWMLDQPRARQQFAQAARRRIERDFDQRELAAAYAALYEHLLVRPALALPRLAA
ncbi:MAG TPA: glycosyltransferase, partial [Pirellulaceae bacterium]|nr:glycosyltransferase [Pirellulaceae bacterium]